MTDTQKRPGLWRGYGDRKLFAMRLGAVLLTAISQPLLSAPFSWWPLHWIAWLPFLWAIFQQEGRGRLWLAWIGGTAANYMIFYWIVNMMPAFSKIPFAVAVVLNLLLCMWLGVIWILLAWLLPKIREHLPHGWTLAGPALLVALEYATPQLFPYMQGVSHYQVTPIFLISSITGVYGMSFLVFWSNCMLYQLWLSRRSELAFPRWQWLSFASVLILVLAYGQLRIGQFKRADAKAKRVKIALIQANFRPKDHSRTRHPSPFQTYVELSKQAAKRGAQWAVWSEGEYKGYFSTRSARRRLQKAAKQIGIPILVGGFDLHVTKRGIRRTNSALHIHPKLGYGKRHDKVILVPFGEYMPFAKQLHFIYKHIGWNSRYSPGKAMVVDTLDDVPYGFLICYEAIYPSLVRSSVRRGARLLVNITYDAWFGRTTAPYQHLMLAAVRSAELGVPLARLATTGVSTSVNSLGQMQALSPLFQRKIPIHSIPIVHLPSIYAKVGDVFAIICTLLTLFFLIQRARSATNTQAEPPTQE